MRTTNNRSNTNANRKGTASGAAAIREYFRAVANGGVVKSPPAVLYRFAAAALRGAALKDAEDAAADVVGEFLLRIAAAAARGASTGTFAEMAAWSDSDLLATCRVRLRQIASECGETAGIAKQLRAHVNALVEEGVAAPVAISPPTSIVENDRFSRARISEALSYAVRSEAIAATDAAALARWLMGRYGYVTRSLEAANDDGDVAVARMAVQAPAVNAFVERQSGLRLAETFRETVDAETAELFARHAANEGFASLAARTGRGLATVHRRVQAAKAAFRESARACGATYREAHVALEALRAAYEA